MSFARLFNGGAERRAASQPSGAPSAAPQTAEGRIGARLTRYAARATKGLESQFVPEELGSMFVTARTVSHTQVEGSIRPL